MGKIEWTDRSDWNALRGCTRESPGCVHCYAETMAARFSNPGYPFHGFAERTAHGPRWTGKIELVEDRLTLPLMWKKPATIFVNSMSDPFHPNVPDETVDKLFAVMAKAEWHKFQILTKRPERMRRYMVRWPDGAGRIHHVAHEAHKIDPNLPSSWVWDLQARWPLPNVMMGTSIEDAKRAGERIPPLQETPAAIRFISFEPLLSPLGDLDLGGIHWAIVGGESGPGARVWDGFYDEARSILRQCRIADVAFFMKQTQGPRKGAMPPIPDDLAIRRFPR